MNRKQRIAFKAGWLIAGILFAWCLASHFVKVKDNARAAQFTQARQECMEDSGFELALWNPADREKSARILIKWWNNPENETYYFFVPEALFQKGMYWMFPETNKMWVDGEELINGGLCRLKQGVHEVAAEFPEGSRTVCNMELRFSSQIATMFLETDSGSLDELHTSKENEEPGTYLLLDSSNGVRYAGVVDTMHCRGNASWAETDKKSYQLKLSDKADFLGMGEAKKWLLLANAFDNTLLRNVVAFDIAKGLGLQYTPDAEFVDVYANGEFMGNYLLTEKPEIGRNRVNINNLEEQTVRLNPEEGEFFMEQQGRLYSTKGYRIKNEPEEIRGGYFLEIEMSDRYGLEASGFITSRMQAVVIKSPEYASYRQVSYIADRYQDFEDALFSEDGYSPYTGTWFGDYIDIDSFARKYLLEELTKNLDASYTSQFFYKPEDDAKFFAGPAWDYDKAIAASGITQEGIDLHDAQGLYAAVKKKDSDIWYGLYQQKPFRNHVIHIYQTELVKNVRMIADECIDAYAADIEASAINNMLRWQIFTEEDTAKKKRIQYLEKVQELKDFLNLRLDFLNNEWGAVNE